MSLTEKYPTMHRNTRLIEQCLADPLNKTPGGKRRHPKYSLQQWNIRIHCFDIQRNNKWRRITIPEKDYVMRNWINELFRYWASSHWIEGNNWRIGKYARLNQMLSRHIREIVHHMYIHLNERGLKHTECEVSDAMYRYFTRCTNSQHLEREY
jgi:hypothetical protein